MRSLRNRLYLLMVLTGILLALSACGSSTSGSIEDDVQKDSEDSGEYSEELPSDMPTDAPTDYSDEYYEDMEDIYRAREQMKEEYLQETMYYDRPDVDKDRFFYRLSCIANRPSNQNFTECYFTTYNDIMRNIYDYSGMLYGFYGSVDWVDRNGSSTALLVEVGTDFQENPLLISCAADTDIKVVSGDCISVFGTLYPSSYVQTNSSGNQSTIDCPGLDIQDYWVGPEGAYTAGWNQKGYLDIEGAPDLPQWQTEYWFGNTEYTNRDGKSIVMTESSIDGHPYTICRYIYFERPAKLVLYLRFDEVSQYYKDDQYTILELEYNDIYLYGGLLSEDRFDIDRSNEVWQDISRMEKFGMGCCSPIKENP